MDVVICPHPIPMDELVPELQDLYQQFVGEPIGDPPECVICELVDVLVPAV